MSNRRSKVTWANRFTYEEAVGRVAIALIGHPFDYAKTLIQLGYEPMPPYPTKTIFGTPKLALPNVFKYMGYIRSTDGQFGYFRGVKYKIASTLIYNFVYINSTSIVKSLSDPEEDEEERKKREEGGESVEAKPVVKKTFSKEKLKETFDALMRETFCKFISLAAAYPMQLLVVRSCAQFIGRETVYDSFRSGIRDIYTNSGISGFYAGFMPRFLYDVFVLWSTHGILLLIKGAVLDRMADPETGVIAGGNGLESYVGASVNFLLSATMYPFHVVSTVMACNGRSAASLEASALEGKEFIDWTECWRHLSALGQLKRGSSLIFRYQANQPHRFMFPKSRI